LPKEWAAVVLADLQPEVADVAAGISCTSESSASGFTVDVADFESVKRLVEGAAERHGRLDYIFNNAGIAAGGELRDHTLEAWKRGYRRQSPRSRARRSGGLSHHAPSRVRPHRQHGVDAGLDAVTVDRHYSTTKHAIVGLSKALRVEAAGAGVRISVLCPGVVRTPLLSGGKHGLFVSAIPEHEQRARARRYFERLRPMDVRRFAARALDQVGRNRAIIVVPAWWKLFWWLDRLSPRLSLFVAERVFEAARKDLFGASATPPS
jgi:NAD(P)-dependent dehydrogenase (short-subunit alcohol dehydrogenase family)